MDQFFDPRGPDSCRHLFRQGKYLAKLPCLSQARKDTEALSRVLREELHVAATHYHAGLGRSARVQVRTCAWTQHTRHAII